MSRRARGLLLPELHRRAARRWRWLHQCGAQRGYRRFWRPLRRASAGCLLRKLACGCAHNKPRGCFKQVLNQFCGRRRRSVVTLPQILALGLGLGLNNAFAGLRGWPQFQATHDRNHNCIRYHGEGKKRGQEGQKRGQEGRHGRKGDATIDCNSGTVVLVGAIG